MAKRTGSRRVDAIQPEAPPVTVSRQGARPTDGLPTGGTGAGLSHEALALFQRGMQSLQLHAFAEAATAFRAVMMGYSTEVALVERCKVYLELAERESERRPLRPQTIEERLTAATSALNKDEDDVAEELARTVLGDEPKNELALYLLAAVKSRKGDLREALDFLRKAIALSPDASTQARTDQDFLPLHDEDDFWTITEPPISASGPRRRRVRSER